MCRYVAGVSSRHISQVWLRTFISYRSQAKLENSFTRPPLYNGQKYYLNKRCVFSQITATYTLSGPKSRWHYCRTRLTHSRILHSVTTLCRELKTIELSYPPMAHR